MAKHPSSCERGDHICAIYSSLGELAAVASDFLAEGLRRGERCWYVAAGEEGDAVRHALRKLTVNVDAEIKRGALSIIDGSDSYVVRGEFDPERTMAVFNDAIEHALNDGFSGFRAAADMSWALTLPDATERIVAYEALLRTLFANCQVTGLCLYHRERMPLKILQGALVTHPLVVIGGECQDNPFHEPAVSVVPDVDDSVVIANLRSLEPPPALR